MPTCQQKTTSTIKIWEKLTNGILKRKEKNRDWVDETKKIVLFLTVLMFADFLNWKSFLLVIDLRTLAESLRKQTILALSEII